jgi:peptidoglycan/LPS O-acetylase OafA/YrhL
MKTARKGTSSQSNINRIVICTVLILIIPLVAMQFTNEVNWGLFDFIFIGTLLIGTGLAYEILSRKVKTNTQRLVLGIALVGLLLLILAELAIGVFGSPFTGS